MAPCTVSSASAAFMWCLLTVQRTSLLKASFQSSSSVMLVARALLSPSKEVASPGRWRLRRKKIGATAKRSPFQPLSHEPGILHPLGRPR